MAVTFFLLAALAGVAGFVVLSTAASAIQEAVGAIFWVIGAIFLSTAAIVDAIRSAASKDRGHGAGSAKNAAGDSPSGEKPLK